MGKIFHDTLLIGYDDRDSEHPIMIVGRKIPGNDESELVNAFEGDHAKMLYSLLTGEARISEESDD